MVNKCLASVIVCFVLGLGGCAMNPPAQKRLITFNEADFEAYGKTGSATITGQAFLKTKGGEVRFGAGNEVVLAPVNAYTDEIHSRNVLKHINLGKPDDGYYRYRRTTRADGNGNFEFRDLPAGQYYLWCGIAWQVPGYGGVLSETGDIAFAKVTVKQGETVKAVVTR